ncbi:type II CRISPR-associated endonuclease Cas1 [Staphylococcus pseudintermedius]|nr:type II CRISPR-associated endonuclease Cas1 [Staphylococcus pseudintermedius]MCE5801367.1 type II CRISPR-associated endonuclease Cas1 [Staphylococcus pseudintermedius]MCE5820659.1 type II CRISPR-associated endonuclease Cas1 [Staphylococcus pseudintermedius]
MKDVIYVENHYFVTVKENSIKFRNVIDKSEKFYLFEEIEAIIFDHYKSYFSHKLVIKCIENDIAIIFCDKKHSPLTQLISSYGMTHRLQRIQSQFQLSGRTRDRIWKKIVVNKIINQSKCLENNLHNENVKSLVNLAKDVSSGDKSNKEAQAARIYFKDLYGKQFKRGRYNDIINSGLNYGYSILRSFIKKELALHGFEMSLGINHRSKENPFNLADDIIEVFRPFVDNIVYEIVFKKNINTFDVNEKKLLLNVLYEKCIIDKKVVRLLDSVKIVIQSLIRCYEENTPTYLLLPKMIEVGN